MTLIIEYEICSNLTFDIEEEYFFEAWASSLDELIAFSKTININDPDESGICVYKDNASEKYVVPFIADGPSSPLNYGEFLEVKSVDEKYCGIEEGRTYITNLGMLAMISVVA